MAILIVSLNKIYVLH